MFPYTDPTGGALLAAQNAIEFYRQTVHQQYRSFARLPGSHFTLLDAFEGLGSDERAVSTVTWLAFPRSAVASFAEIDDNRFTFQDEYVEWWTEEAVDGAVTRVTFTTEFPEYYESLASVSVAALVAGIRDAIPGANPSVRELFGPEFDPAAASPEGRAAQFRARSERNPWNNGTRGILFLTQGANTLGALFNLVGRCAVVRLDLPSSAVCANVGGACGPNRNSDPVICSAVQNVARLANGLTLADPVGVRILRLEGIWKIGGVQVDINDPAQNQGAWSITRNGRRAVLDVTKGVTVGDATITNGTQVAAKLQVGASVISAPESVLPAWARTGQESSRIIS